MKSTFAVTGLVLVVMMLAMPQDATAEEQVGDVPVLSFNILRDLRNKENWRWEQRRNLVLKVIRDADADVLLLQEISLDMRKWLETALVDYEFAPVDSQDALGKLVYGGLVAFRKDRFRMLNHGQMIFPPYSPTATERDEIIKAMPCLYGGHWAVLDDLRNGMRTAVLSVHVPHQKETYRFGTADLILEWLDGLPAKSRVIMSGDFNETPNTPVHKKYLAIPDMRDARLVAGGPDVEKATITNGRDVRDIIDWVLYRGALTSEDYRVLDYRENGILASDHRAVYVRFVATDSSRKNDGVERR